VINLAMVFNNCTWQRKFKTPPNGRVVVRFRVGEELSAARYLGGKWENTRSLSRSLYLCNDSEGPLLCITEDRCEKIL